MRTFAAIAILTSVLSAQPYVISTYAGGAAPPNPAPATSIAFGTVWGVASDASGNAYISSVDLNSVFRLDPTGLLTRVAGNGRAGFSGDGGPAAGAELSKPQGIAVDTAGNLFIADYGNARIRKVSTSGVITTIAGNGACCFGGDGGPATSAPLETPFGVAVDSAGNIFVADLYASRVRKVSAGGTISTVAGDGSYAFSGDGGPAALAQLNGPVGVAADGAGNLFIADCNNHRIREVTPDGAIQTVAGNGIAGYSADNGDGGPAAKAQLAALYGVALDNAGNLFIVDYGRVRKVASDGTIATVAGGGTDWLATTGPSTNVAMLPYAMAIDGAGNLFLADSLFNATIRKVTTDGNIATVAGNGQYCCFSGDGGPAVSAQLSGPASVALDANGNLYIADAHNSRIRRVTPDGSIATVARGCYWPDDAWAACGLAVDSAGNVYLSEEDGTFKISSDGSRTKLADHGVGLALDSANNLFVADQYHNLILKVAADGTSSTVSTGPLNTPTAIALDQAGNLYIADSGNKRIRMVAASGAIATVVDVSADLPDNYSAAGLGSALVGLAVDGSGNVFFEELSASFRRIRRVAPDGTIATIAGTGAPGYSGDGGPAANAQLNPSADEVGNTLAIDRGGNLYVADGANGAVRVLRPVNR